MSEGGHTLHSVSLADFDIKVGNTISHTWPPTVNLQDDIDQDNLHDLCFPDGAHAAERDTVCAILSRKPKNATKTKTTPTLDTQQPPSKHLFAVACYRSLRTSKVERGAVQRAVLVITEVPLFATVAGVVHDLLGWWLSDEDQFEKYRKIDDNDAKTWVDVAVSTGSVQGDPRTGSEENDRRFIQGLHNALRDCFLNSRDGDRHVILPFNFSHPPACKMTTELTAPFVGNLVSASTPRAMVEHAMGYGCSLKKLIKTFKQDTAKIYAALLRRRSICFVAQSNADDACSSVLAATHLIRPLTIDPSEVIPYATVTDLARIEQMPFVICGATNPFFEDAARHPWATLICNVSTGEVSGDKSLTVGKSVQKMTTRVVEGVVEETRTEAWIRNYYEGVTARALQGGKGSSPVELGKGVAGSWDCDGLEEVIKRAERIAETVTKCHDANKKKTAVHAEWFAAMIEAMRAVAERSETDQKEMFNQIASYHLDDDLSGFADITVTGCASRTERCAVAQLAYEENKTRLLLTELRERIYLLIDSFNSRNDAAVHDEENRFFSDTFNTPEYQLYNMTNQVFLLSGQCYIERRDSTPQPNSKVAGKMWVSKNYMAFAANWLSRVGSGRSSLEVIPFDLVTRVDRMSGDSVAIVLKDRSVFVVSVVHESAHQKIGYKMATLLETLAEKQKRTVLLLGLLGPNLKLPAPSRSDNKSVLGLRRQLTIPAGLYLYERTVTEEVFELLRFYPLMGWSSKLMPTDPPSFTDSSGRYERRMVGGGKFAVGLPAGWDWESDWLPGDWEFSRDFKGTDWKIAKARLHVCKRRRWTRTRRLVRDEKGDVIPVMMLPSSAVYRQEEQQQNPSDATIKENTETPVKASVAIPRIPPPKGPTPPPTPPIEAAATRKLSLVGASSQGTPRDLGAIDCSPEHVLPETTTDLDLRDFTPPAGLYNPFHATSEAPGCGVWRYEAFEDPGAREDDILDDTSPQTALPDQLPAQKELGNIDDLPASIVPGHVDPMNPPQEVDASTRTGNGKPETWWRR